MTQIEVRENPTNGGAVEARPSRSTLVPRFFVEEGESAIFLSIEIPGARLEDVTLAVEDRVLTLRAQRPAHAREGYRALATEFFDGEGSYERSFALPDDIDPGAISAELRDGVLTLTLPRAVPERREIPVRGA